MCTTIRLSEETKGELTALKREDESFDDVVARLLAARTERDLMAGFGVLGEGDAVDRVREAHDAMDRQSAEYVREIRDRADAESGNGRQDADGRTDRAGEDAG